MAADPSADVLVALERAIASATPLMTARLLGDLERLQAILWQRLLHVTATAAAVPPSDSLDELRHLTPHQAAALLNLKPAYVHELCRTRRIPATKSGKYWMISVAGLRQWLAYENRDVDEGGRPRLESPNPRRYGAPSPVPARRSRRGAATS